MLPLRVRRIEGVRLHIDLTMLATLASACSRPGHRATRSTPRRRRGLRRARTAKTAH
jgi:hypothetical protein